VKKLFSPWWLLVIAASGTALLAWAYWGGWNIHPHASAAELGQLGDFFGGMLNPLVSALTLFVAISVWRLQKDELEQARIAMEQTNLAMKEQAVTAEQQRQEQRFFDLLNIYQQTVSSISMVARMSSTAEIPVHYNGKEAIAHFFRSAEGSYITGFDSNGFGDWHISMGSSNFGQLNNKSDFQTIWNSGQIPSLFDHYFRVVFRVLSESNDLLGDQHHRYVKLFRAQLSRNELSLLGFNLWLDEEGKKMIPLVAKYGLLKHLQKGHLRTELEKVMPPSVFGRKFAKSQANANSSEATPC